MTEKLSIYTQKYDGFNWQSNSARVNHKMHRSCSVIYMMYKLVFETWTQYEDISRW
jgi:hypothetical protein